MPRDRDHLPLVYSCSGCSSAAQVAHHLAVRLDRAGLVEMSCIAGVGGNVPSLVRKAEEAIASGRGVLAIDGCALQCVKACLAQRGLEATAHVRLDLHGVKKEYHADADPDASEPLYDRLVTQVRAMAALSEPLPGSCGGGCGCAAARAVAT